MESLVGRDPELLFRQDRAATRPPSRTTAPFSGPRRNTARASPGSQRGHAAVSVAVDSGFPRPETVFASYSPHRRSWPLRRKGKRPCAQATASVTPRMASALLLMVEPAENQRPIRATSARAASLGPCELDTLSSGSSRRVQHRTQRPPSWV